MKSLSILTVGVAILRLLKAQDDLVSWRRDLELEKISSLVQCDFPVINGNSFSNFEDIPYKEIPFILTNLTDDWKAHINWQKQNLLKRFGDRQIRSGSESSIVYSGGNAEFSTTLETLIEGFEVTDNLPQDQFAFDTTILSAIPEMKEDFTPPKIFEWDQKDREANREIWHMLSLGASRAGLPFHNHGKTWIAVIHGSKRWFIYPPGHNPPKDIDNRFPPTLSAWEWFQNYYPLLKYLQKPFGPVSHHAYTMDSGFKPLECIQRPGDIMFLPDLWSHMTLNIGETIAVGAQEAISGDARFAVAEEAFAINPNNYEALKDLGLSIYFKHLDELESYRDSLTIKNNIIFLDSDVQATKFLSFTNDPMIIIRYLNTSRLALDQLIRKLQSYSLNETADIIVIPFEDPGAICVASDQDLLCTTPIYEIEGNFEIGSEFQQFDDDDYYLLFEERLFLAERTLEEVRSVTNPRMVFATIHDFPSREAFMEFITPAFQSKASIHTVSVRSRRIIEYAIQLFRRALSIKPLQPEALQLLCEASIMIGDLDSVVELVQRAEKMYDTIQYTQKISNQTIASMYYKLALLVNRNNNSLTIRLLEKVLERDESLILAWQVYFDVLTALDQQEAILQSFEERLRPRLCQMKLLPPPFQGNCDIRLNTSDIRHLLRDIIQHQF